MTNSPRQTAGLGGGWHTASQGGWGASDFQEKRADSWGGEGGVRGGGFEREALTRARGRACLPWTSAPCSMRGAPSCVALSQFHHVRTEQPSGGTTSAPLASRGWAFSRPHWAPQAGQLGCQEAALLTQKFWGAPHQCPKQAMPAGRPAPPNSGHPVLWPSSHSDPWQPFPGAGAGAEVIRLAGRLLLGWGEGRSPQWPVLKIDLWAGIPGQPPWGQYRGGALDPQRTCSLVFFLSCLSSMSH